jgi:hypothetical protein
VVAGVVVAGVEEDPVATEEEPAAPAEEEAAPAAAAAEEEPAATEDAAAEEEAVEDPMEEIKRKRAERFGIEYVPPKKKEVAPVEGEDPIEAIKRKRAERFGLAYEPPKSASPVRLRQSPLDLHPHAAAAVAAARTRRAPRERHSWQAVQPAVGKTILGLAATVALS